MNQLFAQRCHWISVNVNHVCEHECRRYMIHVLSRSENHVREHEWLLLRSKITWCYTDVSNTALILAVQNLNMNQLLCPEWVSEWHSATGSTVRERESRPQRQFSACSRFANHEWITVRTWITSWQFSEWVAAVPLPAGMIITELRKERISSWSDSVHFIHLKDKFIRTTRSWMTQHYHSLLQCIPSMEE